MSDHFVGDGQQCGRSRSSLLQVLVIFAVMVRPVVAMATITEGDFSFFGSFNTTWAGRWGEGSERGGTPSTTDGAPNPATIVIKAGKAPNFTGGSFDFNHWDLVEARQSMNLTTDDHVVKNYKLLGRIDTLILQDANFYADYEAFYDALPDFKDAGRAEPNRDWSNFTSEDIVDQFTKNELDEYYGQLNFTDNFSMKVGKQQVIWSEADAFSGTEVTNPPDYRYSNIDDSSRVNLRMVKFDYILPDYLQTANNLFEFFWIPGDFQGGYKANITDARNPWIPPVPISDLTLYNQDGQPFKEQTLLDQGETPMYRLPNVPALQTLQRFLGKGPIPFFADLNVLYSQNQMGGKIGDSEFGGRYSTLIPIGNGLQASAIWLYEARSNKLSTCVTCTEPAPFTKFAPGIFLAVSPQPFGIQGFGKSVYDFGAPQVKNNLGTIRLLLRNEYVRQNYFGLTGTYYDKDLTDMVFRYDTFYAPKVAGGGVVGGVGGLQSTSAVSGGLFAGQPKWGEASKIIIAADRPTYIPWISKQHTFLVAQYVAAYDPDTPTGQRALNNFFFLAANNWLMDGRLTSLNVWGWDPDDNTGLVTSGNNYRYSSNITLSCNATWFLGKSGVYGNLGGILSRAQRTNEFLFKFTYEI
jgi:hypothetical protein